MQKPNQLEPARKQYKTKNLPTPTPAKNNFQL